MQAIPRAPILAVLLAVLGTLCLVSVPLGRHWHSAAPVADLELIAAVPRAARIRAAGMRRGMMHILPGQQLVGGTETYPYWEREYTGDPEGFADVSSNCTATVMHAFDLPANACCLLGKISLLRSWLLSHQVLTCASFGCL